MQNIPSRSDMWRSWAVGALGVGAVVTAFFVGGRTAAADLTPRPATALASDVNAGVVQGVMVECEPGQRAVIRQAAGNTGASAVSCVGAVSAVAPVSAYNSLGARSVNTNYVPAVQTRPAVMTAPPVARTTTYRAPVRQTRSTKKSVAIIAGSTAAGAIIGGVAKGKKGAVVGGIVGGAAATVWDQVTRRKGN
jgi:hypothetical protein